MVVVVVVVEENQANDPKNDDVSTRSIMLLIKGFNRIHFHFG